jgi:predicted transglutaminase-like cysteine proteinase
VVGSGHGGRRIKTFIAATGAQGQDDETARLAAVNQWVNRNIQYREDRDLYGKADYWAPSRETLRRGAGDCEDLAIVKLDMLGALGIERSRMRLVIARDLVRNADHAVLIVEGSSGAFVLDNATDRLLDARMPNDYRPIMSFTQNGKWVHGYAVQPAPMVRNAVMMAGNIPPTAESVAELAEAEAPALITAAVDLTSGKPLAFAAAAPDISTAIAAADVEKGANVL